MKALINVINDTTQSSNKTIDWELFIRTFWTYSELVNDYGISMYDAFNRPARSRTGLPTVIDNKYLKKLSRISNKSFIGKNIKRLVLYGKGATEIQIQMCTPAPDGIIGFPVINMDCLVKTIGEHNVIKIYEYMCSKINNRALNNVNYVDWSEYQNDYIINY